MIDYEVVSFGELVQPLSAGRWLLVLAAADSGRYDEIECYQALLHGLNVTDGSELIEEFGEKGYLLIMGDLTEPEAVEAHWLLDRFRDRELKDAIHACLLVDGKLAGDSRDGRRSIHETLSELGCHCHIR